MQGVIQAFLLSDAVVAENPDVVWLQRTAVGPGGLSESEFAALIAGWEPEASSLWAFLVATQRLDRVGMQTLLTVQKGYSRLPAASLRHLFRVPAVLAEFASAGAPSSAVASTEPEVPEASDAVVDAESLPVPGPSLRDRVDSFRRVLATARETSAPAEGLQPGDRFGGYSVLRLLGESAQAQVFQAFELSHRRPVVLKVPRPEADLTSLPRFAAQARVHARFTHPGLLPLIDPGGRDGRIYVTFADRGAHSVLTSPAVFGTASAKLLIAVCHAVADVLAQAARIGLIHGDIHPRNILFCERAQIHLTDFSMAIPGRPRSPYTAPELVPSVWADMYALGVVLVRLATGDEQSLRRLAWRRPDLPAGLLAVIEQLTAVDPEQRFRDWDEVLRSCGG